MFCLKALQLFKKALDEWKFALKHKKNGKRLARFEYLFYLCTAIERETLNKQ